MGWGYTCFVSSFALFVSEREIQCAKSPVLKAFSTINSLEAFKQLKLPIINETDASDVDDPSTNQIASSNLGFEIDLR
jgi:hypothetical protein